MFFSTLSKDKNCPFCLFLFNVFSGRIHMFKDMKLGTKLLVAFLSVGLIPFAIVSLFAVNNASDALSKQAFGQLESVRGIKKAQIERFFGEREGDLGVLVETVNALKDGAFHKLEAINKTKKHEVENYFKDRLKLMEDVQKNLRFTGGVVEFGNVFSGGLNSLEYKSVYQRRFPGLNTFEKVFGFYDVFLIDLRGNVVFTVEKESDWGENLVNGPLKNSGLAKAFREGKSKTTIVDYEYYEPSKEPAAFIGTPLKNSAGRLVGVAAFQLPSGQINDIVQQNIGLGETGESYLVGRLDGKTSYRSDRVRKKGKIGDPKSGHDVDEGLAGKLVSDVKTGSSGEMEVYSVAPLKISGLDWIIETTESLEEVIAPKSKGEKEDYFAKYISKYGYYDLFLMSEDGYVFYTVTKEADYQTNMVSGKYSSSNLGELVRKVMSTKRYGMADFAPYAPSNGDPAAFIAQPILNEGGVELVVALQLSLEAINDVMQQREGMGETGETYLVGSDSLMRSDSYLDPKNHNVKASFANPSLGKVDTEASREALAGKTAAKIVIDYNGNPVLSAYTPLKIGDTTWALIAEKDEWEAFAAVKSIEWLIFIIAIIGLAAIVAVALLITRSITGPINRIIDSLSEGSAQVTSAAGQISQSSQQLASGSTEQAASLEETSASLEETSSQTQKNAENAGEANTLSNMAMEAATNGSDAMDEMLAAMGAINESSQRISKIIKVIEEIAFQTNLLALNAAVEAARAGEAGKGFAVVAEEVRNLAQRSATAAKDTAALIEESVQKAETGNSIAERAGGVLKEIVENVNKTAGFIQEISTASKEQAEGVKQVNTAVTQMDEVTQQNAASAEENASASEELSAQSENLNDIVQELAKIVGKTDVGAGVTSPRPARAALKAPAFHAPAHKAIRAPQAPRPVGGGGKAREIKPDELIPMDDPDDFKDF